MGASSEAYWAYNEANCKEPCPNGCKHVCKFCEGAHMGTVCCKGKWGGGKKGSRGK